MGVIMMLMTICGLIVAGVLLAVAYLTQKDWLRTFVLGGVATWLRVTRSSYLSVLSSASNERWLLASQRNIAAFILIATCILQWLTSEQ